MEHPEVQKNAPHEQVSQPEFVWRGQDGIFFAIYAAAFVVAVSIWLIALRAPLWLDETGSYWHISAGFSQIWARHYQTPSFPAYEYILWLSTKFIGASEIALRVPSILAMLGASFLLYLAAREFLEREIAFVAAILFCLNPIVTLAAIDVRPYAFAVLVTNASILILFRLRRTDSNWMAALFGISAACILYFLFIFGVILPALLLVFFVLKIRDRKAMWRQFGVALAVFSIVFLPLIPEIEYLFQSAGTHVFEARPTLLSLAGSLAPVKLFITSVQLPILFYGVVLLSFVVVAILTRRQVPLEKFETRQILVCASLALIPLLILFGISVGTSIHIFVARHRLEAVPGISLCWAMLFILVRNRSARLIFCLVFVAAAAYQGYSSSDRHEYSWKSALEAVEKNVSVDNAPVVICSDFPESDYVKMPVDSAKDSPFFSQLSYYKLSVPVVLLPRSLSSETMLVGTSFLEVAGKKHERFLAMAWQPSYKTLDWMTNSASRTYSVRTLGIYEGVKVLEFVPRPSAEITR